MRPCSSRITSSTTCCTCTFWKYCAAALTEVTSHDQGRDLVEDAPVAVGEHLEGVVDHHRIQRRGAGHQQRSAPAPAAGAACGGGRARATAGRAARAWSRAASSARPGRRGVHAAPCISRAMGWPAPRQFGAAGRRRRRRSRRPATSAARRAAARRRAAPAARRAPATSRPSSGNTGRGSAASRARSAAQSGAAPPASQRRSISIVRRGIREQAPQRGVVHAGLRHRPGAQRHQPVALRRRQPQPVGERQRVAGRAARRAAAADRPARRPRPAAPGVRDRRPPAAPRPARRAPPSARSPPRGSGAARMRVSSLHTRSADSAAEPGDAGADRRQRRRLGRRRAP